MMSLIQKLNQIGYKKLIWILAISETLHNIEEAIWLPEWSRKAGNWHPAVGAFEFRFAVIIMTLIVYLVIYYYAKNDNKIAKYFFGGALVMILINVFIPHLAATIVLGSYAPGLIGGIMFNVPVTLYLLNRGLKEKRFEFKTLLFGGVIFTLFVLPLLPVLFTFGKIIDSII